MTSPYAHKVLNNTLISGGRRAWHATGRVGKLTLARIFKLLLQFTAIDIAVSR